MTICNLHYFSCSNTFTKLVGTKSMQGTDLTNKLEPAFLAGLKCKQAEMRDKYFEVFNQSQPRCLYERLVYVTCFQNWEGMNEHYWIKQVIQFMLHVCSSDEVIIGQGKGHFLPSITQVVKNASNKHKQEYEQFKSSKMEPMNVDDNENTFVD